jgi:DivIVA domain-containing protein
MKITALEIEQRQFEKSFRGYDIDEVNRFLANIAAEWDRSSNETKMLKMQLEISEKEASKLREVEHTLIKTLKTAEEASSKIAESAKNEASKKIEDAEYRSKQILSDAQNTAAQIITDAEQKSRSIQSAAKAEFQESEDRFASLEQGRDSLVAQLSQIAEAASKLANVPAPEVKKVKVVEPQLVQEIKLETQKIEEPVYVPEVFEEPVLETTAAPIVEVEEEADEIGISFASEANKINLEVPSEKHNLEIIEGIGPKIKQVLNDARISTFRDLATIPIYRIKDILDAAGPHFAAHDPSTWVEQALLAESGEWEKLDRLKEILIGGRAPKKETSPEIVASRPTDGGNTEEMLDKVNKVKAAIRKSMIEKNENSQPALSNQGSFFDNINL